MIDRSTSMAHNVLPSTDDFFGDITRDNVTWCHFIGKPIVFTIQEVSSFSPRSFTDQTSDTIDACRMKLNKLHVLIVQTSTRHHGIAVSRTGVCRGAGEVSSTKASRMDINLSDPMVLPCSVTYPVAKTVLFARNRCKLPSSRHRAMTPRHRRLLSSINRSRAKYSTK